MERNPRCTASLLGLAVAIGSLALAAGAASWAAPEDRPAPDLGAAVRTQPGRADARSQASFKRSMDAAMARMMTGMHAPSSANDPDGAFLEMMIPHHQGAVDMAQLVLEHGRDPLTRQLAEHILATQSVEILAMRERLRLLATEPPDTFPVLSGTRGAQ